MDEVIFIGIAGSVLTGVSLVPQLSKIIKEKKAENVSMWMLAVLFAGLAFWIWYGVKKDDPIIIISSAFSMLINSAIVFFALKYKRS